MPRRVGWGFGPVVNHGISTDRLRGRLSVKCRFPSALLVSGDQKSVDARRRMIEALNSHARTKDNSSGPRARCQPGSRSRMARSRPERFHGIGASRPAGRQIAGQRRHGHENRDRQDEADGIGRRHSEQQASSKRVSRAPRQSRLPRRARSSSAPAPEPSRTRRGGSRPARCARPSRGGAGMCLPPPRGGSGATGPGGQPFELRVRKTGTGLPLNRSGSLIAFSDYGGVEISLELLRD